MMHMTKLLIMSDTLVTHVVDQLTLTEESTTLSW